MGKPDIWMPLYVADYLADTQHLTTAHHGAYLLMLMASWMRGGRLADDEEQLAAICRMDRKAWAKAKPVLAEFFTVQDGFWVQGRLADEYEEAQRISNKNRENGKKGGRPRKPDETQPETQTEPKQEASLKPDETPAPSPTPKPKSQKLSSGKPDLPSGFVKFWETWPRSERKQGKAACADIWRRKALEGETDLIVAHVAHMAKSESWQSGYDPMPETYLNKRRWDGADLTAGLAKPWEDSWSGIVSKGAELGIFQDEGESGPDFKARVMTAAKEIA